MKNHLLKLCFFILFYGISPVPVGAEMSRTGMVYEYFAEYSNKNDTHPTKNQTWKKKGFRWKKKDNNKSGSIALFTLLLIFSLALFASGIGNGGAIVIILGLLLSLGLLILLIRAIKRNKSNATDISTKEENAAKPPAKKGGMIVGIVFLVLLTFLFALWGIGFIIIATALGGGLGFGLLALLSFSVAGLCISGIVRIARKLKRLKEGYTPEAEELPRRPPSRPLKTQ